MLGEDPAPAGLADLVAGPADALEAPADRAGRLDLDDEVDRAHVDAQLERSSVPTRPLSRPPLRSSSMISRCSRASDPWWALTSSGIACRRAASPGAAARRRTRRWCSRRPSGVSPRAMASCSAASSLSRVASRSARRRALTKMSVVRWARTSSSSSGCIDGQMLRRAGAARPARSAGVRAAGRSPAGGDRLAQVGHVVDRDDDLDVEHLAAAGVDDGDRAGRPSSS